MCRGFVGGVEPDTPEMSLAPRAGCLSTSQTHTHWSKTRMKVVARLASAGLPLVPHRLYHSGL